MRRNLRLDWRALALLGALLSIIIEWPGLVCAMPTIFLPATTTTAAATTATSAQALHNLSLAMNDTAAATATAAIVSEAEYHNMAALSTSNGSSDSAHTSNYRNNSYSESDSVRNVEYLKEYEKSQRNKDIVDGDDENISNSSDSDSLAKADYHSEYNESQQHSNESVSNLNQIQRVLNSNDSSSQNHSHTSDSDKLLLAKVSTSDDQLINVTTKQQNRKEINEINENQNGENQKPNSSVSNKTHSISNKINVSDISNNASNTRTLLENTTAINDSNDEEEEVEEEKKLLSTSSHQENIINNKNNIIANNGSNINNTTNTATPLQKPATKSSLVEAHHSTADNQLSSFTFSSSHHMAILSRTERSIRAGDIAAPPSPSHNRGDSRNGGGGGSIVRRSSSADTTGNLGAKSRRLNISRNSNNSSSRYNNSNLDRNERSTISHLSGPSRKIQLYIKNRFIQLMPDGTVNGTQDDQSEYTILQRSTVDVGRIKIQSVATCLYLCMDQCGAVYGSKDFTDDCVFNENMEQHNYNTYSSTYNSNSRRIYYLALNRHGEPRKLQIPPTRSLGKLATYTNAITETVPQERVEQLIAKNFGANRIKHGIRQLCDTGKPLIELIDSRNFKARPKCNPNSSSSSSNSNSNSNSSTNSSSKNISSSNHNLDNNISGQLLNNVPAANDNTRISSSSSSNSNNNNSSSGDTNSNSSSSPSSISNSQNNNGHISSSNSNSNSSSSSSINANHHNGGKKKKKRRKCRPHENEDEHNCHRGPLALRKKAQQNIKKCRELQQQQQANGEEVVPCPSPGPKRAGGGGPKKNGGPNGKKAHNGPRANRNNFGGNDPAAPNNRRGKKLNANARHNANRNGGNGALANKKRAKNAVQNGGPKRLKLKKLQSTTPPPTTTTTARLVTSSTVSMPSVLDTTSAASSTPAAPHSSTVSIYDSIDLRAETTSDRGEREQRNVHFTNSMEDSQENSSSEQHTATANDEEEDEDVDLDDGDVEESEDSYEAAGDPQTQLNSGADDFLYYDQLDF